MSGWPESWRSSAPGATCPSCGEPTGRPILRGMPGPDVLEALDAGEIDVVIGGCSITDGMPTHACSSCGTEFASTSRLAP